MAVYSGVARVGKDKADVRFTKGGLAIASWNAAVDAGFGDNKKTTWIKFKIIGKRAEGNLPQYILPGTEFYFDGELTIDKWDGQDGQKMTTVEVNVSGFKLLGGKRDNKGSPQDGVSGGQPGQPF